jgi:glutathione S-transferase
MILFDNPASPFCRKVNIVLAETGQQGDVTVRPAIGHPLDSGKMPTTENPLGKIPTLLRDNAAALYDSRVICQFLNARAVGNLYPEDALWDVLTLEATGDGICDAAVAMVYEGRTRPADKQFPDMVEAQWSKIERALDTLETRWVDQMNAPLNIGQIACIAALGYLDFRLGDRDWRAERPVLAAWFGDLADRPSVAATMPFAP